MPHFYRRSRVDANHAEIVSALRRVGVSVLSLASLGDGCPDLLCSYRGRMFFIELKRPGRTLSDRQRRWIAQWDPHASNYVVDNVNEAITVATSGV